MADIFISYASEDRSRVKPLADALSRQGWSVWWDRTIPAGKTFDEVIDEELGAARSVVVVWTRTSVRKNWVLEEAEDGRERGILIPVFMDQVKPPRGFRRIQAADLVEWDAAESFPAFQQLIKDLTGIVGPLPEPGKTDEIEELQKPLQPPPAPTVTKPPDTPPPKPAVTSEPPALTEPAEQISPPSRAWSRSRFLTAAVALTVVATTTALYLSLGNDGASSTSETHDPQHDEELVWGSLEGCQEVVNDGRRMTRNDPESVLVGSWNIRWFPSGCMNGAACEENNTNIDWLACTITWMGVDVLATQEILTTPDAESAMNSLVAQLGSLSGGVWEKDLQECGSEGRQHVGFLWDSEKVERVQSPGPADLWELNGDDGAGPNTACASSLRPGRFIRVRSKNGGVDFNLISVHLDSGKEQRDYSRRRNAIGRLDETQVAGQSLQDVDVDNVVIGDFNTMGRDTPVVISPQQELATLDAELGVEYQRLPLSHSCTEYYERQPSLLDHIVVSTGMIEASAQARVTGYCAALRCEDINGSYPPAYNVLSDHCPIVFEVTDADVD